MNIKLPSHKSALAFTLAEMMITATIFVVFCVLALVSLQIFGLRTYTLSATKLTATASATKVLNSIQDTVRSAQGVTVGTYSGGTFQTISSGSSQIGNAVIVYPTDLSNGSGSLNTNIYKIFYADTAHTNLSMIDNNGMLTIEAHNMTNYYCFQAEDAFGNVLTQNNNHRVIRLTMAFSQWEFPTAGGVAYDFYQLRTRITCRVPDRLGN
jgi:type II secretory pathway pseudopilin PulG